MEQKTPEDDDARFSNFVKGVVKKAQTKTKCESSDTLRDVIKAQIQTWLDQIVNVNPLYKVSEIIPVGSYAEGTKISHPDEFDYLVVVEEFSKPDIIEIDTDSSDIQQGLVKVVILDQVLKSKCSGLCRDGHLQCFQPVSFPERNPKQQRFGHVLIKHLSMLAKRSKQGGRDSFITVTPTEVQCMMSLPTENNCPFYLKEASFKAPNVFIEFIYNNMIVSVDISPAIRYHKIQDCFIDKECAGPAFAELVLNRQSILLVGTSDESDFKVTVTEAEVEYIQKVMKPEHKIIYIFLKYIVYLYAKMELPLFTFTSYMMKTICIHHDIRCETKERSIQGCFKMVINDLNDSTRKGHVVSIVNKHILLDKGILEKSDREFLLRGIEKMCQLPTDIETVDDFDEFLMEIVKNEGQKKNMERQEREKRNREAQNNFAAKVKEKVAKIVDMGFDKEEAKVALERTWKYDVEQAIRKLRKQRAKRLEEQKQDCVSEENSNKANSFRETEAHSRKILPGLPKADEERTHETLYQRQKEI